MVDGDDDEICVCLITARQMLRRRKLFIYRARAYRTACCCSLCSSVVFAIIVPCCTTTTTTTTITITAMEYVQLALQPLWNVPEINVRDFPIISTQWAEVAMVATPLYLGLVFLGPRLMKPFAPFELKYPMMLWNLALSVLSLFMFLGISIPTFEAAIASGSMWYHIVTLDADYDQPTWVGPHIFWMWLFGLSKLAELGDTVFLVLRKRPVPFLHWYHHTTVLSFTWFAMWALAGPGFMFAIMNSFVHVVMYFYYFVSGFGWRPWWGKYITQLQMAQMVMGVACSVSWTYYWATSSGTRMNKYYPIWFISTSSLMYASYFYLFLQFYLDRYKAAAAHKANKAAAAAAAAKKSQ